MDTVSKKTLVRILTRAKNILIRNKWTKRTYAKDPHGFWVEPQSPDACQFCMAGAILLAADQIQENADKHLLLGYANEYIREITGNPYATLINYNDKHTTTKKEAVAILSDITAHYKKE